MLKLGPRYFTLSEIFRKNIENLLYFLKYSKLVYQKTTFLFPDTKSQKNSGFSSRD